MKLSELLESMTGDVQISLFEGDMERHICFTKKSWLGVAPYEDRKIVNWEIIRASSDESQIRVVLLERSVESAIDQLTKVVKEKPPTNRKVLDKTKKNNHRCKNCKYWNGMTCNNMNSPKYTQPREYYHSCTKLEWRKN